MAEKRGLVVSPPIRIAGTSVYVESPHLHPQELRSNLLFWDKLDFPTNPFIGFGLDANAQFLIDAGILQRTDVRVSGGQMGDILRAAHVAAFQALDQKEPGQWSLASGEHSISFLDSELEEGRGALVRLHQAIPVPDEDVPFADILEFRVSRRTELLALRHHLEQVYQRIITAGDGPLAWNTEVEALQIAIADHIRVARESNLKFRLSDLSAGLNLVPLAIGALTAHMMDLPLISGLLPAAASSISLEIGVALKKRKAMATPFRYVSSYHDEVF